MAAALCRKGLARTRSVAPALADADIGDEVERLAIQAEGVFASRAELRAWLVCACRVHRAATTGRQACDELSAAACAVRFGRQCAKSSTPRDFVDLVAELSTTRLEALLALSRDDVG